jgi:hypothetical protein
MGTLGAAIYTEAETMMNVAQSAGTAAAETSEVKPERKVYRASTGRRTIFSFVFLILLPFFASLPAMLYMRYSHGLLIDSLGLTVIAAAFAIVMFLLFIELMFSLRTRVDLGPDRVKMTIPSGRGPTPMLRYKSYEIPYDQVHTVETRREVYGGGLIPMLLKGARLTLKDGKQVPLGYVSEANVDPAFPFPEIAKQIADRARLPLIDRGNVRRSVRHKFLGIRSAAAVNEMVSENDIANLNHSHNSIMMWFIGAFVVLMLIGIADDISSMSTFANTSAPAPVSTPAR